MEDSEENGIVFSFFHSFQLRPLPQIYLFTGENAFALREEKIRWISEFVKKHGEENLVRLLGRGMTFRQLLDEVAVAPFIAEHRLVVIDELPSLSKEEVLDLPKRIHPQTILLFVEPKLDKRLGVHKQLRDIANVKEYMPLHGKGLHAWIVQFLAQERSVIEPAAEALLLEMFGEDQDMLSQELRKLALAVQGRAITAADVERIAMPTFEGIVWTLTDLLAAGKRSTALLYAHRYLARGGDAYGLWAILLGMLRNLVAAHAAAREGKRDLRSLAADLQIHPFALRSIQTMAARADTREIERFLNESVEADIGLKTGAYRATDEAPEELIALIDRFILSTPA